MKEVVLLYCNVRILNFYIDPSIKTVVLCSFLVKQLF